MRFFRKRSSGLKPIHHDATVVAHIPELPPPSRPEVSRVPTTDTRHRVTPRPSANATPQHYVLCLSDGQEIPLGNHCVVGRLQPTGLDGIDSYATIDDSSGLISRRHFEFGATQDGSCWVMDAGSANGTYLVTNGHTQRLDPLAKRPLTTGDEILFGSMTARLAPMGPASDCEQVPSRRGRRARQE